MKVALHTFETVAPFPRAPKVQRLAGTVGPNCHYAVRCFADPGSIPPGSGSEDSCVYFSVGFQGPPLTSETIEM